MARLPFLKVDNNRIVDDSGKPIQLKGFALGGWLIMEGYMLCGRNITERQFKAEFEKANGKEALDEFTRAFRDTFIRESDIKTIKEWGANCIRVPFNYRIVEFEDRAFSLNEEGLSYLDRIVDWCEKYELYCILDMHAAPGGQNEGWHSDNHGTPDFFGNNFNIDRYLRLWHFLADRYCTSSAIAGYDVMNEPVVKITQERKVKEVYEKVTKEIRDVDDRHIIFLEGNVWAQRLKFLGKPKDKNTAYSAHMYAPIEFTFNLEVDLTYPCRVYKFMWDKKMFEFLARQYTRFTDAQHVPLYVGEFGVNWRGGHVGELDWVKDMLDVMDHHRLSWSYWTYKTVANYTFPDGVYRYVKSPKWVNRHGPIVGWENFAKTWPKDKKKMIDSWKTENFELNEQLLSVLQSYFK